MGGIVKLFLTRKLPEKVMKKLEENFHLRVNPKNRAIKKDELITGTKWCDILICLLSDKIDSEIISVNPKLKGIVNYAVGYNNIDVKKATKLSIPVTNTPGVLTETTADLAWSLLMSVVRRIPESDRFVREGKFKGWTPKLLLGGDVFAKTLGIIGAGRIGRAVAKRAIGFNMNILYLDKNSEIEKTVKAEKVNLRSLLKRSDFVTIHVPLNKNTEHLIGKNELMLMKRTAYLINTSRGAVIDEKVLVKALQDNWIAGAGLDVYEKEPKLSGGLKECENAVLVPHIGSATIETRTKMGLIAVENAIAIKNGEIPPQLVNL